jgi:hypothetical protein
LTIFIIDAEKVLMEPDADIRGFEESAPAARGISATPRVLVLAVAQIERQSNLEYVTKVWLSGAGGSLNKGVR